MGPLTQILSIDGKDVEDFTASFANGSDLNKKLMGRKQGDQVVLKIVTLGARVPKLITLTEGRVFGPSHQDTDEDETPPSAIHVR
jgi:C-terminal processing protease CtpA/Prc